MPRFPVTALRSVDLGTPDLALSERFYCETWGLEPVARSEGVVYLRATGGDRLVPWDIKRRKIGSRMAGRLHSNRRPMLYLRMRDCRVVRLRPSREAAPSGPDIFPLACFSAWRICSRSAC